MMTMKCTLAPHTFSRAIKSPVITFYLAIFLACGPVFDIYCNWEDERHNADNGKKDYSYLVNLNVLCHQMSLPHCSGDHTADYT